MLVGSQLLNEQIERKGESVCEGERERGRGGRKTTQEWKVRASTNNKQLKEENGTGSGIGL